MRERRDAKKKQQQEAVENKLRRVQLRESSHALKSELDLEKGRVVKGRWMGYFLNFYFYNFVSKNFFLLILISQLIFKFKPHYYVPFPLLKAQALK